MTTRREDENKLGLRLRNQAFLPRGKPHKKKDYIDEYRDDAVNIRSLPHPSLSSV